MKLPHSPQQANDATHDPLKPRSKGIPLRSGLVSLLVHLLLLAALGLGVKWHVATDTVEGGQAELWSAVPKVAAPQSEAMPPVSRPPVAADKELQPTAPPKERAEPKPVVKQEAKEALQDLPTPKTKAQIAIKKETQPKVAKSKAPPKPSREEPEKTSRATRKPAQPVAKTEPKKKAEVKTAAAAEKPPKAIKTEPTAKKDKTAKEEAQASAKLEAARQENLRRLMSGAAAGADTISAGEKGARTLAGSGQATSKEYASKVAAAIKRNIIFPDSLAGNPMALVQVRCSTGGQIMGQKLIKSSGSPNWDEAVLRAIERTEILPKDEKGKVPCPMEIEFRPLDR